MRSRDPIIGRSYNADDGRVLLEYRDGNGPGQTGGYHLAEVGREFRDAQPWPPPRWHGRKARAGVVLWRSTLVRWQAVDDGVARLARVTELKREAVARRPALAPGDVAVMWACRRCGCVTSLGVGAGRPDTVTEAELQHYTDCSTNTVEIWRASRYASKLLRCRMQIAQGVVARRYRCWECQRICSEAAIEEAEEAIKQARDVTLRNFHRRRCSQRDGNMTSKTAKRAELMRSREVSGQEVLFSCQP